MSPRATGELRVNVWALIEGGIEGPLRAGIYRAFKHSDRGLSDAEIDRVVDQQHSALMGWFAETFDFGDGE